LAGPSNAPPQPARFPEEKFSMLVDLLAIIPAVLAGIGGALLGDKVGVWIKKSRTSGNS
jgi:hypothetical protein